jgi:phosphoribosylformylglycinamidine cyclo-ligase
MERGRDLPINVAAGDVILGLASDGVHSNGFSLIRKLADHAGLNWASPAPFGKATLGDELLRPTRLYIKPLLPLLAGQKINALAHITGGGLTENLPRVLPNGLGAQIDLTAWALPPVFDWARHTGNIDQTEMLKTFNCGIGLAVIVPADLADGVAADLAGAGETVARIGLVTDTQTGVTYHGDLRG